MNKENLKKCRIIDIPLFIIFTLNDAKPTKICLTYISNCYVFTFHVFGIFTVCVSIAHSFVTDYKTNLTIMSAIVLLYSLRHLLLLRKEAICITVDLLNLYRRHLKMTSSKKYTVYIWLSGIYCLHLYWQHSVHMRHTEMWTKIHSFRLVL